VRGGVRGQCKGVERERKEEMERGRGGCDGEGVNLRNWGGGEREGHTSHLVPHDTAILCIHVPCPTRYHSTMHTCTLSHTIPQCSTSHLVPHDTAVLHIAPCPTRYHSATHRTLSHTIPQCSNGFSGSGKGLGLGEQLCSKSSLSPPVHDYCVVCTVWCIWCVG
jgi:hypothetical protein